MLIGLICLFKRGPFTIKYRYELANFLYNIDLEIDALYSDCDSEFVASPVMSDSILSCSSVIFSCVWSTFSILLRLSHFQCSHVLWFNTPPLWWIFHYGHSWWIFSNSVSFYLLSFSGCSSGMKQLKTKTLKGRETTLRSRLSKCHHFSFAIRGNLRRPAPN